MFPPYWVNIGLIPKRVMINDKCLIIRHLSVSVSISLMMHTVIYLGIIHFMMLISITVLLRYHYHGYTIINIFITLRTVMRAPFVCVVFYKKCCFAKLVGRILYTRMES